jgi:hypothetical protein
VYPTDCGYCTSKKLDQGLVMAPPSLRSRPPFVIPRSGMIQSPKSVENSELRGAHLPLSRLSKYQSPSMNQLSQFSDEVNCCDELEALEKNDSPSRWR